MIRVICLTKKRGIDMVANKGKIIWNIPRLIKNGWSLLRNPRIAGEKKLLLIAVSLGYFFFPIDLIPDFFPLLGQIDDIGLVFLVLNWFVNSAQKDKDVLDAEYYFSDDDKKDPK